MRKLVSGALTLAIFAGLVTTSAAAVAQNRASATEKGSVLVFPKVELRWASDGQLRQDTIIQISNDWPEDTKVLLYFVSETCTWVDNDIVLTMNEPAYWSVASGMPKGVSPWTVLGNAYPDPEGSGDLVMRGYVIAFAVNNVNVEVAWNHLYGSATLINYACGYAWEYNAYAFQALAAVATGTVTGTPGVLNLNGTEFDYGFEKLLFNFFASGSGALSAPGYQATVDTDLTLLVLRQDLRQETVGPYITKAKFEIWNENEVSFSGLDYCVNKWAQTLLSSIGSHFLVENLQTDAGRARISSMASPVVCPDSTDQALLGVVAKMIDINGSMVAAGTNMVGAGVEAATIEYDPTTLPPTLVPAEVTSTTVQAKTLGLSR